MRKLKKLGNGQPNPDFVSSSTPTPSSFMAWDGEGWNVGGVHVYTLMMNNLGGALYRATGISTEEALAFLCDGARTYQNSIHIGFATSYDCNMIFRDIPRGGYTRNDGQRQITRPNTLEALHAGYPIRYLNYEIEYRARKSLKVRRYDPANKWKMISVKGQPKHVINWTDTIVLYDVFGFFQCSFVAALKQYMGEDYPKLQFVEKMKKERGGEHFDAAHLEEIQVYCHTECQMLVELMDVLREHFKTAGLQLSRWDGAGAAASALLKREGIKEHKEEFQEEFQRAAEYAYAGGRIETLQYGHIQAGEGNNPPTRIWHYDIRSAYPAAMTRCPSLKGGYWETIYNPSRQDVLAFPEFALYRVRWDLREGDAMYPFFFRTEIGNILFPRKGANWVWGPELLAALDHHPAGIKIEVAYVFRASNDQKPFAFLHDLFALRAQWKKSDNASLRGAEKVIKLSINSLYGKLAQKQGSYDGKDYRKPPFHQIQWAGYSTAYTRAMLYRMAMRSPNSIVSIQTDGITSTVPLLSDDELSRETGLGSWEFERHAGMTQVVSGVYWLDDYQQEGGISTHIYCRGFQKQGQGLDGTGNQLSRKRVVAAWTEHQHVLPCASTRFVTLGSALAGDDQFLKWRTFHAATRNLQLDMTGTKRRDLSWEGTGDYLWGKGSPAQGMIRTEPEINHEYEMGIVDFSKKHALPWDGCPPIAYADENGVDPQTIEQEIEDTYM